jgi:hypothetical protein
MRVTYHDVCRFTVASACGRRQQLLEIHSRPDGWGGWAAWVQLRSGEGAPADRLGRVFRARERGVAIGKMVLWVRRRFALARPERGLRAVTPPAPGQAA